MSIEPPRWNVLPHGPLQRLDDNLWSVTGSLPQGFLGITRRMTVLRLHDDKLLVHSAVALDDATQAELEALGEVAVVVVPNGVHRMDAPAYRARYPKAKFFCPAASRGRVQQVVRVDGTYDALPAERGLRVETLAGTRSGEAAFVIHNARGEATLLFNDAVFNVPHRHGPRGWLLRAAGFTGPPRISRLARLAMVRNAQALAQHMDKLALEPKLVRVLMSHGEAMEERCREGLEAVARSIRGGRGLLGN